jgi:hypothetical protein
MLGDMREMRTVTKENPDLTFMVLADRADAYTSEALGRLGDWTTAKLVDVSGGSFTEVEDWGERNLGDPAALIEFLDASVAHAPADHYALVFWDHGALSGIGSDESHSDVLELPEIASGLDAGLASSGIGILDMVGFDACLMASLEVASAVHPYAAYMIASEDLIPNEGWAYAGFEYLATAADPTVEGLGRSVLLSYTDTSAASSPSVTLSLLDLRRYSPFVEALGDLSDVALDSLDTTAVVFGRRRDRAMKFGANPNPEYDWFMVDLGQLLAKVARSETVVSDDASRVLQLMREMVVDNRTGEATAGATGLSVHFPPAPEWFYPSWYDTMGAPVWESFLNGYFDAGRAIPVSRQPAFNPSGDDTTFLFDDFGIEVTSDFGDSAVDTVVSAVLWSGVEEPDGSVTFYSSDQGLFDGSTAVGFYDLTRLVLDDGEDSAIAFQQITFSEDLTLVTITVPLSYRAPIDASQGQFADPIDVTLRVGYDLTTDEFTEDLFSTDIAGTVGAFTAEPDGLLFPKLPHRLLGGEIEWIPTTDVGLWADLPNLGYDFVELPSGTQLLSELRVSDFGGHTAAAVVSTVLP